MQLELLIASWLCSTDERSHKIDNQLRTCPEQIERLDPPSLSMRRGKHLLASDSTRQFLNVRRCLSASENPRSDRENLI